MEALKGRAETLLAGVTGSFINASSRVSASVYLSISSYPPRDNCQSSAASASCLVLLSLCSLASLSLAALSSSLWRLLCAASSSWSGQL